MKGTSRSDKPLRTLSLDEMGIDPKKPETPPIDRNGNMDDEPEGIIPAHLMDSPLYQSVVDAKNDGYAGVVFSGPPGTGKSWYAAIIAESLAGSRHCVRAVQFHASYQYEDFVEGWVADESGGFILKEKHFLKLCADARADPSHLYILVIDELSRADVGRVFGEALTYLETSKRGVPFFLASGKQAVVPDNLFVLATMNPWDISVGELDYALERRFAVIEVLPNSEELVKILEANQAPKEVIAVTERFFSFLQERPNPLLHIGHAYFDRVKDQSSLQRLWTFQLRPHVGRVCRLDQSEISTVDGAWKSIVVNGLSRAEPRAQPEPAAPEPRLG